MIKKHFTLLLCAFFTALVSFAQNPIPAHFDECVDLVATVWRLSGAHEYNRCDIPSYAHEVDSVFAPYKEHQVVQLARQYPQQELAMKRCLPLCYRHLKYPQSV